jgi:two-component system response regulator NreC
MAQNYRIVIAEDYTILREGLRSLLSADPAFEIVGEAEDGRQAIERVAELKPDLVLLDLSMPRTSGLDAIREIKRLSPQTRICVLTIHKAEEYILATLEAGADGYVLKEASHAELTLAIRSILEGKRYLSPGVSGKVIEGYLGGRKTFKTTTPWDTLTQREREILKLIAEGYRNSEIAEYLFISVKTVEKHRANLMKKLNLHSTAALTAYGIEKGLVTK